MGTAQNAFTASVIEVSPTATPTPPPWVFDLLGSTPFEDASSWHEAIGLSVARATGLAAVRVVVPGVRAMDILTLQQVVAEAYQSVFEQLRLGPASWPVRFWAFIPGIHAVMSPGLDRYMVFNAGRFAAYSAWCGGREAFSKSVPTASAVGAWGEDLVLYCLAAAAPATPAENPRQVPAYRYSRKYGPMPPCFARSTLVQAAGAPLLLVGGTASIRGEDSVHVGHLEAQAEETFRNLAALVRSALAGDGDENDLERGPWLDRFRDLRVYHPRLADRSSILALIQERFRCLRRVELIGAELCRAELLVEIEGLAEV
jgi:chorismate lyase/3-hydroxybenzoate synthase